MITHLSRFATSAGLRTLAGAALLAASGAAGILVASQPSAAPFAGGEPLPPAAVAERGSALPAAVRPATISDVTLASAVLAALDADPVLKDVNVIVSVVDRGAVVGGPVLSDDIKKRVEEVVRGVPGVASVKNTCFVHDAPDPLMRAVAVRMKPGATPNAGALPGAALAPDAPNGFLPQVQPPPSSDLLAEAAAPAEKTVVAQKPVPPTGPVLGVLGSPVSPPAAGAISAPPVPGALTGSTPARPADLRGAVTATRQADPRFARLAVEQKPDGGLFVTGWSAKTADAMDFAAELRKIPGVVRVAVDPNLVK